MPVDTSTPRASEISRNEGILRFAAIHQEEVTFRYVKGDDPTGPIETRKLVPAVPHVNTAGQKSFNGVDPDRGHHRTYRLDRILGKVDLS